ncbi:A-kinase anchor protein 7 [Oopsacas minuta]|uniref:A-kinase anchor protein 7 n=1 Tax=Oopsacas minuta TaxID=111878 RepID=A0AAV7K3T8_9METZ|nr:A-kinase anchor protein 7 [Oopsacas minuta]
MSSFNEYPTVPASARPVRYLADKNNDKVMPTPVEPVVDTADKPIVPNPTPMVPYSTHKYQQFPPKTSPQKFQFQPISFTADTKVKTKNPVGGSGKEKPIKPRIDTFIGVHITSPPIISKLSAIQSEFSLSDASVSRTLIRPSLFHFTLLALYTGEDLDNIRNAIELITIVLNEFRLRHKGTLSLNLTGIGHFSNKVLFASLLKDNNYQILSEIAFSLSDIFSKKYSQYFEEITEFTPHLTLAKTSKTLSGPFKQRMFKFNRQDLVEMFVRDYSSFEIGEEKIFSIELLSMSKPKTAENYYHCYHTFHL